jgi:DNA-binding response OmpR family regulator
LSSNQLPRIGDSRHVGGAPGPTDGNFRKSSVESRTLDLNHPLVTRVLVVEDEAKVAAALKEGLEGERYDVAVESTGEGMFFRLNTEEFDIILLDLTLPNRNGLEILRTVLRLHVSDLVLDVATRKVTRGGCPVDLTVREFELLEYLLRHEGQIVSRDWLARDIWNEAVNVASLNNVIDVHMARLRRKIHAAGPCELIHTVRGVGFTLRDGVP